jgi:microcystin-dependent protein
MGENSNFKVPKFENFQSAIGYDPNDEDFANIGQTGGEYQHSLTGEENPYHYHYISNTSHSHSVSANDYYLTVSALQRNDNDVLGESNGHREYRSSGNSSTYYNHNHSYTTSTDSHTHMCDTVGRSEAHTNMQPYFGLNFIIKY